MKHDKYIDGHITVTLRFPLRYKIEVEKVEYFDDFDEEMRESYFVEEYEYGPEEAYEQDEKIKDFIKEYNNYIEDIIVDEY